jgi:hypothetical protein
LAIGVRFNPSVAVLAIWVKVGPQLRLDRAARSR